MLKKWGIWIVGFVLMVTPLLILLFFWIAIDRAADSLSEGIGEMVLARSQAREAARPPQPAGDRGAGSAYSPDEPAEPAAARPATATTPVEADQAQQKAATAPEAAAADQAKPPRTTRAARQRVKPAQAPARASTRARAATPRPDQPRDVSPTSAANTESLEKIQEVSELIGSPGPESRNSLIRMLNGDDPMLRVLAAQGLSSYQDNHIVRIITAAANRETDPSAKHDLDQIVAQLPRR